MQTVTTVGVGQIACALGDVTANLQHCEDVLQLAAERGVQLLVLPECALSGYAFDDLGTARSASIFVDGPEVKQLIARCAALDMYCVVGFLEEEDDDLFNTAALIGPEGLLGRYRKSHLPFLGADRFTTPGTDRDLPVFDTGIGRIGLGICYDLRFPEWTRSLALAGADLVALPTNWPPAAQIQADHFTRVRACENRIFLLVADRWDVERGVQFIGQSQILNPAGEVLARAGAEETIVTAEVDVTSAREKRLIVEQGVFELSFFADRRPDLYGVITTETEVRV